MKKDIELPKVEGVAMAVVPKEDELGKTEWSAFLINMRKEVLENVLISSRGYGEDKRTGEKIKTSTLRHYLENVDPNSYSKIELVPENLFGLKSQNFSKLKLIY